jgi:Na+-transporting NADH:ubiquinone oxidoreductase subunit C
VSIPRTVAIVFGVALVCSIFVSTAVLYLRPLQVSYASIERYRVILELAGIELGEADDAATAKAFQSLEVRVYDLADDRFAYLSGVDPHGHDHWDTTNASLPTMALDAEAEAIGVDRLPRYVPIYIVRQGDAIDRVVLPVHGRGMWSTIYGYVAVAADFDTVAAINFHDHGETPGIGDRIQDERWLAGWQGKRIRADDGSHALAVTNDPNVAHANRVDAISGATITSEAVGRIVSFWVGPSALGPMLEDLRQEMER